MREQFRDVSPEDAELQPIIEGCSVNMPPATATTSLRTRKWSSRRGI